jgi:dihydrofolate reductase
MSTQLNLIYASAANGVIGQDNAMPWHLPEDLAHFKRVTMGCPVIMGRKTWDSLPERFRPLPGRDNIVITRDRTWQSPGARVAHSLNEAVALCASAPQVWVMGGAQIYALALPLAHRVVVTEIDQDFAGDAWAPTLGPEWRETDRQSHSSASGLRFAFVNFERQET